MVDIIKRSKALSVSPLKASQTIGAALAFLGFKRAIPMLHGSQGCTAFAKIYFVRHFREPIPLQTTAMEQVSTIMGSEENILEGLKNIIDKSSPSLLGLATTGLAETQGSDVGMAMNEFRKTYPQYDATPIVAVTSPDFSGSLESGFAKALESIFENLVPPNTATSTSSRTSTTQKPQVNVLVGSFLTPGDLEEIKEIIESFNLHPVLLPDLSDSLDGHLDESDFSSLTIGGTEVSELANLHQAIATLVIGDSMHKAADMLHQLTNVPDYRFEHMMGIDATDKFINTLHQISGNPVAKKLERQRAQLQDALLDSHFMLGQARFAVAADPDLLFAFSEMLTSIGAEVVTAVTPVNARILQKMPTQVVKIGDLEDLEQLAKDNQAEVLICNSHGVESAERLGIPLYRAGFPQYDTLGGYQKTWIGYKGNQQVLFELANIMLSLEKGEIHPYHSKYKQENYLQESSAA